MTKRLLVSLASLLLLLTVSGGLTEAETREATLQTLAKLQGKEREDRLVEGARKEGGLIWYTSTTAEDSLALIRKFQEQYPFLRVQHFRAPSEKMIERILLESRAGKFNADPVSLPEIEMNALFKRNLSSRYESPEQEVYPPEVKDPRGDWIGMYISADVLAYNATLVSPQAAPKSYRDLLHPKWKGGIGMDIEPFSWFVKAEQEDLP